MTRNWSTFCFLRISVELQITNPVIPSWAVCSFCVVFTWTWGVLIGACVVYMSENLYKLHLPLMPDDNSRLLLAGYVAGGVLVGSTGSVGSKYNSHNTKTDVLTTCHHNCGLWFVARQPYLPPYCLSIIYLSLSHLVFGECGLPWFVMNFFVNSMKFSKKLASERVNCCIVACSLPLFLLSLDCRFWLIWSFSSHVYSSFSLHWSSASFARNCSSFLWGSSSIWCSWQYDTVTVAQFMCSSGQRTWCPCCILLANIYYDLAD